MLLDGFNSLTVRFSRRVLSLKRSAVACYHLAVRVVSGLQNDQLVSSKQWERWREQHSIVQNSI